MGLNVSELFTSLQASHFRDLAGARAAARIPIARGLVNHVIAAALEGASTPIRGIDVRPRAGDRFDLVLTLSWPFVPPLKVSVAVAKQPELPASPLLVFRWSLLGAVGVLASRVIAALDRLPPGVRLDGDLLVLDLPVLAARGPAATLLPYLKTLEVHTLDERIVVDVGWEVPE
jgi:hypothetical protein